MSSDEPAGPFTTDEAVHALLLLMPRIVGKAKRMPVPAELREFALGPRHLSLLSFVLLDGPLTINQLARRLEVAPTTVSLLVSELSRKDVLDRHEDPADRRRKIVSIAEAYRAVIADWLAPGADSWREVLEPLEPQLRRVVVEVLRAYERTVEQRTSPDGRRA
ncbi:MarR family winged helix-turn-helix transcriptional regulator [Pseudonocardia xinjiangensis]|uniref:MarR family winged helix-turn-helix transcriptional regulator n=1 Tax=Pseudonocardia xinjiangensis TaxID=75289 RepID=UPI003D8DD899